MDTNGFYAQAAEVLAACHAQRDDLSALLDPDTGFAPRLSEMCRKSLQEVSSSAVQSEATLDDIDMLRLESNTWDLIQLLMSARKIEHEHTSSARDLLRKNPYTPTATLAQAILHQSPLLNELVIVREWLHDIAPPPSVPEIATGYWRFTRLRLQQAERTGDRRDVESLVTELDPDASNREDNGKVLSADDANYEKALAQALYGYVRAGKLDEAIDLCRRTKRPWRAASLRGSLLFEWRALVIDEDAEANDVPDFEDGWSGNKRRKLWKATCTRAALNPLLSEPDRALHAALAPSPATSVVLKAACRTWLDHLWAQVSIVCEGKQVDALSQAGGGGYWEGGIEAVERIGVEDASSSPYRKDKERVSEEKEESEWEREVIRALESLTNVGVSEGPPSSDPFHVSQLHVILNRTDKLLSDFATGIQSGDFNPQQSNFPTLTRFFAHLCLFLRMIDMPVPNDATQVILEVYLQVLEEAGQREHIALYASALGENAVERYALFLTSLDLSVDHIERRSALQRAEKHELNMVRVAQVTAEKTLERAFAALPRIKIALPDIGSREPSITDMEWFLIRSIEWTTFQEETYRDALEQANAIFRYFLGCGKVKAAKALLVMLPTQLKLLPVDGFRSRMQSAEYVHYLQFFTVRDLFDRISQIKSVESESTTSGAKESWLNNYSNLLDDVRQKVIELLTTDWLVNEEEVERTESQDQRDITLVRIRRIFVPYLVKQLHSLLIDSKDNIPRNLKYVFELANVVADSRYGLYEDFVSDGVERLEKYLQTVRQAVLCGLESGGSDPFRTLHSA